MDSVSTWLNKMSSNFMPLTQHKRLKKNPKQIIAKNRTKCLKHIHNAAAAAGACSWVHLRTQSTPNPLSDLQCALLISRWHLSTLLPLVWHHELFRLRGPNENSPEGVESGSPPRGCSIRLRVGESRVPTTAGDRDDKAKQTYIRCIAAKPNRLWRGHEPIHAGVHFQFPPLISRLSLCGLTGRSAPVNLIYPLFRLCLPPASHIFSTWQNLNLSADGVHCCFLWPVGGKRKGWGGRGSFYPLRWLWQDQLMFLSVQVGIFNVCPEAQPML